MESSSENSAALQQTVLDLTRLVARSEKRTMRLEKLLQRGAIFFVTTLVLLLFVSTDLVPKAEATDDVQEIRQQMDRMNNFLQQISGALNAINQPTQGTAMSPIQRFDHVVARVDTILNDVDSSRAIEKIDYLIANLSSLREIRDALGSVPQMGMDMRNMTQNMANMTSNLARISNNTSRMSHDVNKLSQSIRSGGGNPMGVMEWMPR